MSAPTLAWMRQPLVVGASDAGAAPPELHPPLPAPLADALERAFGIRTLFPVQAALWNLTGGGADVVTPGDIALMAPTGSGKTLAYALPIANRCAACRLRATRALVLLPTRELAVQVRESCLRAGPSPTHF